MLDFPASPTNGQLYNGANGVTYQWVSSPAIWVAQGSWTPPPPTGTVLNVTSFGAVGDGVTDNSSAFTAALGFATGKSLFVPSGVYRLSAGIVVPSGTTLYSDAIVPSSVGVVGAIQGGAILLFDLSVATCVTLGAANNLDSCTLRNINVTRATGSVPAGSIGVLVNTGYDVQLSGVASTRHAIGFKLLGSSPYGVSCMSDHLYTGSITENHVIIDSWIEARFALCRFGSVGTNDVNCNAYVQFNSTAGAGPNTVMFNHCQFNQGTALVNYWWDFNQLGATASTFFNASDVYIETIGIAYIHTTANATNPGRLTLSGVHCSTPGTTCKFVLLDPTTQINEWHITNSNLFQGTATINDFTNLVSINELNISNSRIGGSWSFNSASQNYRVTMVGNTWSGGTLTLAGNVWGQSLFADTFQGGSVVNSAHSGNLQVVSSINSLRLWTPVLTFGGATTGITYSIQSGAYQVIGNMVFGEARIILTSKGSASGTALITGFPLGFNAGLFQTAGGGICVNNVAMVGLTGPIVVMGLSVVAGTFNLYMQAGTTTAAITDANFSNTSQLSINFSYFI